MSDDFYLQAGAQRLAQIEAEKAAALADLAAYKANGDRDSAAQSVQQLANLDTELRNLNDLYVRYQQSANPPAPPEPSPEERAARPLNRMDYGDVYQMLKHSKYGVDDNAFREGIAEGSEPCLAPTRVNLRSLLAQWRRKRESVVTTIRSTLGTVSVST